ncbi:MAG: glycosyltransferase [Leptolyngbyaceae cyanobacterium MO_188.B28]|nr:glycosyltransferase [Leptolyngbyaceae cyanobacterium MO_188.B28]
MKTLMFYCQHLLGIGHLIRSMEIARGLTQDFKVNFINGGEVIDGFRVPPGVEVVNLPPLKTDAEFRGLQIPAEFESLEAAMEKRTTIMLELLDRVQPDVLMVELFPFGRRRLSAELIPLLETAKSIGTKVVCSLRDIVVTKQDQARHEAKVCKLMNRYFDLLLIHGDPKFMPLERSFSRIKDLTCEVHYTGYVVQREEAGDREQKMGEMEEMGKMGESKSKIQNLKSKIQIPGSPFILTSVGGGRFGHELLDCVVKASALLEGKIPHHIQMFTGPFSPDPIFSRLQQMAAGRSNLTVERYTPSLLSYMRRADLSISMAGYNTTLNVLTTGVRAMLSPFTGNDDQEQTLRSERLEQLGVVRMIRPEDLNPERFAHKVIDCLGQEPAPIDFDLQGVEKTAMLLNTLAQKTAIAA